MSRLLNVDDVIAQAAEQGVKIGRDTVYDWLKAGDMIGFKLGGRQSEWRIDEHEWDAFVERRRAAAAAERATAAS